MRRLIILLNVNHGYKNLKNFYFKCYIKDNKILGIIVFLIKNLIII